MTNKTTISEKSLLYNLECPLRSDGSNSGPELPVLQCAENTGEWLISEIAAKRQPTAGETREFFDIQWKQTNYYQSLDELSSNQYSRVMEGVQAVARLRDVIWKSEILEPVLPYELPVDDLVITGRYAVLRSSRRKRQAFVLYLREGGVKLRPLVPDMVSFARWVHASKRPEVKDWGVNRIAVMHYWVNQYLAAEHQPDPTFAENALVGAAGVISGPPFPIPGKHCQSCPTRGCSTKPKLRIPGASQRRVREPAMPVYYYDLLSKLRARNVVRDTMPV